MRPVLASLVAALAAVPAVAGAQTSATPWRPADPTRPAWSPRNLSTGDAHRLEMERLRGVADELGTNLPVLSMAWILQHPEISCVIAGASKPGQLENNLKASGFQIPADAMAEIDRITGFHRFERHVG